MSKESHEQSFQAELEPPYMEWDGSTWRDQDGNDIGYKPSPAENAFDKVIVASSLVVVGALWSSNLVVPLLVIAGCGLVRYWIDKE